MAFNHRNMIPGAFTEEVEFVAEDENTVIAFHNRNIWSFEELPEMFHNIVRKKMGRPDASLAEVKAYVVEYHGGIDNCPDIDLEGNMGAPEYMEHHQSVCLENGAHITSSELRVLKLATLPDKVIADQLFIAKTTVDSHWQHMRSKTGFSGKGEFIHFASKKGII